MRTVLNLTVIVLLVFCAGPVWSAPDEGSTGSVERISGQLNSAGFAKVARGGRFSLPKFRVFDSDGRQVYEMNRFTPALFSSQVQQTLKDPKPLDGAPSLEQELAGIVAPDGSPLAALKKSDFVLVDYWAEWCAPCKLLKKQLETILAANQELRITLLEVEADPEKRGGLEGAAKGPVHVVDVAQLDPETVRQLQSGDLSQEEMNELFREVHEAGAMKLIDPSRLTPEQRKKLEGGALTPEELSEIIEQAEVTEAEAGGGGGIRIDPDRLTPEQREKLENGTLTPEEMAEIVEQAGE